MLTCPIHYRKERSELGKTVAQVTEDLLAWHDSCLLIIVISKASILTYKSIKYIKMLTSIKKNNYSNRFSKKLSRQMI